MRKGAAASGLSVARFAVANRHLFRFYADADRNLRPCGTVQLDVENLSTIAVFDIPIVALSDRRHLFASLNRALAVAIAAVIASHVAADHRAGHGTAGRRDVSSATANRRNSLSD
jgi:hypothetical protein